MAPLLTIEGVRKTFASGLEALAGVDLAVNAGEFVSILGASGCGKSTLLRLVAGLAEPSSGDVRWSGERSDYQERGGIGFVFQEPTLMPWADVFSNVYLPLRLAGRSRAESAGRVTEALEQVGLADFASSYPRELSGGMRMRASIARALVTQPEILLLDEPFAALDEQTRFKLNEDLLGVWRARRLTVLFVTHSVFESVFLSTRVVVMTARPGRVAADLPIGFTGERDAVLRTSAEFGAVCGTVSQRLASVSEAA
ncbi:MAG TPA: ABC transporter ATP-binding protein [Alphaproteobacteria bacterium]|nr:ABC transporter ATP-binding protein [Alphaproteobacteria bacterium]